MLSVPGASAADRGAPVVRALQAGIAAVAEPPEVLVNVDADISFEPDYFERLLAKFDEDPALGIASGSAFELRGGVWEQRFVTGSTVWGASRAYRWECLQQLLPLEERVAWDGVDEFKANTRGWRTAAFEGLPFRHHRREGERDGASGGRFATRGARPTTSATAPGTSCCARCGNARREPAAIAMIWGYAVAALKREAQNPDLDARAYLRRQQSLRNLRVRALEAAGRRSKVDSSACKACRHPARLLVGRAPAADARAAAGLGPVFARLGDVRQERRAVAAADERVVFAHSPTNRSLKNLARNLLLAWRTLRLVRPRVMLTTGAGVAVPFAWLARLSGRAGRLRRELHADRAALSQRPARRACRRPRVRAVARADERRAEGAEYAGNVFARR